MSKRYELKHPNGYVLGVAVEHGEEYVEHMRGWRFYPGVSGRHVSRKSHPTADACLPRWARRYLKAGCSFLPPAALMLVAVLTLAPAMAQESVPTTREPPPIGRAPAGQGVVDGPAVIRTLPVTPVPGVAVRDGVGVVFGPPLAPMDASPGISINERIDRAFDAAGVPRQRP